MLRLIVTSAWERPLVVVLIPVLMCVASNTLAQTPQENRPDVVCEKLLEEYILKQGKIETANIDAAIQLIAARGRNNGYWRVVFDHFQQRPVNDSGYLLDILTKILQRDGQARWLRAHPDELKRAAVVFNVVLPPTVVDTIMTRAKQADRLNLDDYVVALVAAHDPRTRDFLRDILKRGAMPSKEDLFDRVPDGQVVSVPDDVPVSAASLFHAAVGLAELGDVTGVQWLVEAPLGETFGTSNVSHVAASGDFLQSRVLALADLTGESFKTIEEAQSWWAANRPSAEEFKPKARVRLWYR